MGDFMSQLGWTSTSKHGHSTSLPETYLPPHSELNTSEQPQISTLIEFERLMFGYLLKLGGHHCQSTFFEPPPPNTIEQILPRGQLYTQGPIYVIAPL